jgi:hypothetical protein
MANSKAADETRLDHLTLRGAVYALHGEDPWREDAPYRCSWPDVRRRRSLRLRRFPRQPVGDPISRHRTSDCR